MVYHVVNKSIAEFMIFNNESEFQRMIQLVSYYQIKKPAISFSRFIRPNKSKARQNDNKSMLLVRVEKLVEIIAYCIMPTHLHLLLKELKEKGVSTFMSNILNSYTRYFNLKHKRKGPLWEGRFKKVLIETDEQLLHVTRYVHLNPVTAHLVNKPEEWPHSSYCKEYVSKAPVNKRICRYDDLLDIESQKYQKFVEDGIAYQRELAKIKNLALG